MSYDFAGSSVVADVLASFGRGENNLAV